jgi:hypothetical protein
VFLIAMKGLYSAAGGLQLFERDANVPQSVRLSPAGKLGRSDGDFFALAELLKSGGVLVLEDLLEQLVRFVSNRGHARILLCVWYPATVP